MHPGVHAAEGMHLLADLTGIAASRLMECAAIELLLRKAANAANARILHSHFHSFGPDAGITGVVMLAESHISIHTWPEQGFAAIDIFMCGNARPLEALRVIEAGFKPVQCRLKSIKRGIVQAVP
nr:adenosylmethionine decarboxylase [Pseudoduganella lurida]